MNKETPPWEQIVENIELRHPIDAPRSYFLKRNKFGTYWLENREGEGMAVSCDFQIKLFEFIDEIFKEEL